MDSVDIVHGLSGHCPWTNVHGLCPWSEWTLSIESVDIVHGPSFQYSSRKMSMDNVHWVHGLSTDGNFGTSSHRIFCVRKWNFFTEYSVCGISLVPYAMARMTRERRNHGPLGQSHLGGAVIWCSSLAVAPTAICVCFLCYYQAVTNPLTYDKDPDIK